MVIKETENDDLTVVLQELIETYAEEIEDVAVGLCTNLVSITQSGEVGQMGDQWLSLSAGLLAQLAEHWGTNSRSLVQA